MHKKKKPILNTKQPPMTAILERLEKQGDNLQNKIEKPHEEKMQRFDRFLDIFEKSVGTTKEK